VRNHVYHPNIDFFTHELFIELLTAKEWKSSFTLNSIIFAIELLLIEPNIRYVPQNSINLEMVHEYVNDKELFQKKVLYTLKGG